LSPGSVLFLQCTSASYYPPILHASEQMADAGWTVTVLSSPSRAEAPLSAGDHPRIRHKAMPPRRSNAVRPLDFLAYCGAAVSLAARVRPRVIYASDPLAALPSLLASRLGNARIVYHEHDSPRQGALRPSLARWRAAVARRAQLVIMPNAERGRLAQAEIGFAPDRLRTVWNLPRRAEVPAASCVPARPLVAYYHGSITPERLPVSLADALRRLGGRVRLRVGGYEAPGAAGYVDRLVAEAGGGGGAPLIEYAGAKPDRRGLLAQAAQAHVGLAFMPAGSDDINMRHMTGASNKAFDYMAAGLALLVSDLDDWRSMYVDAGFARACDPSDPASIAAALDWFATHDLEREAMGALGRAKIEADWNYDAAFGPILAELEDA